MAAALGFTYLDTDAMYREVALASLHRAPVPAGADLDRGEVVSLDGEDVSHQRVARRPMVLAQRAFTG